MNSSSNYDTFDPQNEPTECRHCGACWEYDWEYCPVCRKNFGGAIYPNLSTEKELNDANDLITLIQDAFAHVRLEDGETIHEADLEGAYTDDSVRVAARKKDPETKWDEVPDWKVERLSSALSFFDPKGWRFYLPAFMIWTLRNWRTNDSITSDSVLFNLISDGSEYKTTPFKSLNTKQSECVYQFLNFY